MNLPKPLIVVVRSRYEFSGIKRYLELFCDSLARHVGDEFDLVFAGHPDYLENWPSSLCRPRSAFPLKVRAYRALHRFLPRDSNLLGLPGMARITRPIHNAMASMLRLPGKSWATEALRFLNRPAHRRTIAFYCQPFPDDEPPPDRPIVCLWADFSEDRTAEYADALRRSWSRWFGRADAVVFLAETIRRRAMELDADLSSQRARVITVPPWMPRPSASASQRAQRQLPCCANVLHALVPARAHPRKMQHLILEALPSVGSSGRQVIPVFCGPGTEAFARDAEPSAGDAGVYAETVREAARRSGLDWGRDVLTLGQLDEDLLAGVYARSDLCIFPSRYEGLGLPLLEAMAFGMPVVCSDIPVFREELQRRGLHAWFFRSGDSASLAETLRNLVADWDHARGLALKNQEVMQRYSPEQFAIDFRDLFAEVLDRTAQPDARLRGA